MLTCFKHIFFATGTDGEDQGTMVTIEPPLFSLFATSPYKEIYEWFLTIASWYPDLCYLSLKFVLKTTFSCNRMNDGLLKLLPASAFPASSELVEIVVELVIVIVLVAHQALILSNHNLLHTRIVEYTELVIILLHMNAYTRI
ncbi:hypothetical protein ACJX0J_006693 [Zea mays]